MKQNPKSIYIINIVLMIIYQVFFGIAGKNESGIIGCAIAILIHFLINLMMTGLYEKEISRAYGFSAILILLIGVPGCIFLPSKL